jgi:hypothetical protein
MTRRARDCEVSVERRRCITTDFIFCDVWRR